MLVNPAIAAIPASMIDDKHNTPTQPETEQYSDLLTSLGITFTNTQYYCEVGEIQKTQGWILHLSVIPPQVTELVELIIPYLIDENIPFKVVRDKLLAGRLLNGNFGLKLLGKIFCIYPPTDTEAAKLASILIEMTQEFKGPAIPTDFCLANIVYTRYGSFSPVWANDSKGVPVKHIYGAKGELVPDPYLIPFAVPTDVPWPFHHLVKPEMPKKIKLLNRKYYPISNIRKSPKGDIIKAIYFKHPWSIRTCVIKQGRSNMLTDDAGRSIVDRLKWQYDLDKQLSSIIPMPKAIDYFEENGDTYLVIEHVRGKSLMKWLEDKYRNRVWFNLPSSTRIVILDTLLQVVEITRLLHNEGVIHRDITPGNFIVTSENKVVPIDFELNWRITSDIPSPLFFLGTPGYMSPQQASKETPTLKDDIYSLGTLVLECCTGLNAIKFSKNPENSWRNIAFFTKDEQLSKLIADCLQEDPFKRPKLSTLHTILIGCRNFLANTDRNESIERKPALDKRRLQSTIQAGLNGLAHDELVSSKNRWISAERADSGYTGEGNGGVRYYEGWHTGMAGPLWLVALARYSGFDIERCKLSYTQSWDYINSHFFNNPDSKNPSLYFGGAGIALALIEGLKSELLSPAEKSIMQLRDCFVASPETLTLSNGLAGQGIALLNAANLLGEDYASRLLTSVTNTIINNQSPNGSWKLEGLGMDNGITGILWFLLSYIQKYENPFVEKAIHKGLNWLVTDKSNKRAWMRLQSDIAHKYWCQSQTGIDITLLMIKAFEVLQIQKYKELAEKNLTTIPINIASNNLTLDGGLAKIGHLYLEAHSKLKNPRWLDQATWIANFLLHSFIPRSDVGGYWYVIESEMVTADLSTGISGVLHFLMRYQQPEKLPYPM